MLVVLALAFSVLYVFQCLMFRNLFAYYSGRDAPFHLNLARWNQDVRRELG